MMVRLEDLLEVVVVEAASQRVASSELFLGDMAASVGWR